KNAPRGCALARRGSLSQATALGARVPQAELFVLTGLITYSKNCRKMYEEKTNIFSENDKKFILDIV
ncbi:MAG: hypothetical protein IJW18_03875, partial [Lachnospiraceae bacterium]|nr:hypothetical protein [Lachnospiraceae bacterium]